MQLRNDFRVDVAAERAWELLNDVERIAPCLPGAQLLEIEGDEYRGVVKVKVGPITAQYKGKATFVEQDQAAGRMVLQASGRDTGGGGNVSATIAATMLADGDGTKVSVVTDLTITGKLAQFGKGVLSEVSTKLIGQFVACLEQSLLLSGRGNGDLEPASEPAPDSDAVAADAGAAGGVVAADADADADADAADDDAVAEPVVVEGATGPVQQPVSEVASGPAVAAASTNGAAARPAVRRVEGPDVEPVDLLDAARGSLMKRLAGQIAALVVIVVVVRWWRRRSAR